MKSYSMYKKCPRCKERCFQHEKSCHECGLIFERLNYTSNKSAKKLILKGNYKDTIKTSDWPADAKKTTATLLCLFLGYTGAHNFYLGRFIKAGISLFGFVLAVVMVVLTDYIYGTTTWNILWLISIIPGTCVLLFWFSDLISIIFERYKIPVAIDENLYKLKNSVLNTENNKKIEKNNSLNIDEKNKNNKINKKFNIEKNKAKNKKNK